MILTYETGFTLLSVPSEAYVYAFGIEIEWSYYLKIIRFDGKCWKLGKHIDSLPQEIKTNSANAIIQGGTWETVCRTYVGT